MCGIAGMMVPETMELPQQVLRTMTNAISHRGPDGDGFYYGKTVGLGHRRLSIIDLEGGAQPMYSADGQVIISFNGEIYNYQALRRELESLGHHFTSKSDTEVLLQAYLEWDRDCVTRLRGMFAFGIWDNRKQELFLARDRLGIKPLYYTTVSDGTFVFGSELKAILEHPACRRKLRIDALEDYLALGYVPDPKSLVAGVCTLPPACTMIKRQGQTKDDIREYWSPDITGGSGVVTDASELLGRLEEAVKLRMIADVPLGAFLSGGVDSSAVVGLMSKNSTSPVETCAIGSEDIEYDESGYAERVANHFKTHHRLRFSSAEDGGLIRTMAKVYDDPFADLSAFPTYKVCALAREKVIVALSGDGGDELFAGYRRYKFHMMEEKLRKTIPLSLRRIIFGPLAKLYPKLDYAPQFLRAKSTFEALSRSSAEAYFQTVSKTPDRDRVRLHTEKMRGYLDGYHPHERFKELAKEVEGADPLSTIQYIDLKTYLPGDILTKVDRASMAHSLEVRVPILDHKFIEYGLRLPASDRIMDGEGKAVFKKALEGFLPDEILYRQKKGFIVPVVNWLRNELIPELEKLKASEILFDTGLIDQQNVCILIDEHVSGRRDHHMTLWSLLMLNASLENLQLSL
ncbi:XrtA/PEP-CTERM system amidotransferase [Kordiimonas pumila]|uniref:asparagine synthase (glutamine-hydrolyzing) n=1 Tax=Kordiimonas pumila TaxID=2161677 RepID=A0ABV7D381_9PROT|nr:XrtA/PEP-CTERM system amidotransferase [Kordiimonas pumila]